MKNQMSFLTRGENTVNRVDSSENQNKASSSQFRQIKVYSVFKKLGDDPENKRITNQMRKMTATGDSRRSLAKLRQYGHSLKQLRQ